MIIIEEKSTRRKLSFEEQQTRKQAVNGGKVPPSAVMTQVKQKETDTRAIQHVEYGYIHLVIPKTDKVFVKVRKEELSENGEPIFFNANYSEASLETMMALPLVNFDPTTGYQLDRLVDSKAKVTLNEKGHALYAEIVHAIQGEKLLEDQVSYVDYVAALQHPDGLIEGLKAMGYSQFQIDEFMSLGIYEAEAMFEEDKAGVVRIEGEGYYDQAVEGDTPRTIRFKRTIDSWMDRNFSKMKTKLCHNPVIAFSGK